MSTVTSRRRHKRERKRAKQRRIDKVAARMEVKIQKGMKLSTDELMAAALKNTKGMQAIAEVGAQYIRSRLASPGFTHQRSSNAEE